MARNEVAVTNRFALGKGNEETYSDLKILVRRAEATLVFRNEDLENNDENILVEIEKLLNEWVQAFAAEGIILKVLILEIREDPEERKYAVDNSVNGTMHRALPALGITPPAMYVY